MHLTSLHPSSILSREHIGNPLFIIIIIINTQAKGYDPVIPGKIKIK